MTPQSHCLVPSCLYLPFTKTSQVQAQGRPLCHWRRWPPRPPLAQGQLFTARELHLCPSWISPTTDRQKKMSLLPWRCQVMDFMFTSGVQVKNLGKPLKVTFTAKASLPVVRANMHTPMRKYQRRVWSIGFRVGLCLFAVGYCCACCKAERPWAANFSIRRSPVDYNARVISQ